MKKKAVLALLVAALISRPALAHPGNTAADGGHYCWTRCDYWGEVYGERHFHGSGYSAPKPAPVITYKDWTQDIVIEHQHETRNVDTLDKGQSRIVQAGVDGKAVDKWRENFSDGAKTGEIAKVRTMVTEPVTEIAEVGTREPVAKLDITPASSSSDDDSGISTLIGLGVVGAIVYLVKKKSGVKPSE